MKNCIVGIAGCGWGATARIPASNAAPLGQVAAACSSREPDAAALGARHGGPVKAGNSLAVKLVDSGDGSGYPGPAKLAAFFEALDRGGRMPLASLGDGVVRHEAVFAADRSAELGRSVKLSELKRYAK